MAASTSSSSHRGGLNSWAIWSEDLGAFFVKARCLFHNVSWISWAMFGFAGRGFVHMMCDL